MSFVNLTVWVPLLVAGLGVFGVIVGAVTARILAPSQKNAEFIYQKKQDVYFLFLKNIGEYGIYGRDLFRGEDNKEDYKKMIELRAGLTSAKAAICIYGSSSVVKALAEFELAGSEIKTPAQERAFMAVLTAMRADVGLSPEGEALTAILLGGSPATKE